MCFTPLIIAHRGLSSRFPENTMRSIREALRLQVDAIEIDVRATKDGVLILMHDETVDRTTDGRGAVGELTWSEILRLDAGSWMSPDFAGEQVPRLDEVLTEVAGRVVLHIEVKAPETVRRIVHTVKLHNAEEWVVIASFHKEALARSRQLEPRIPVTLIAGPREVERGGGIKTLIFRGVALGACGLALLHSLITRDLTHYARARNMSLEAWTVNDASEARRLADAGVGAIVTDAPDHIAAALRMGE